LSIYDQDVDKLHILKVISDGFVKVIKLTPAHLKILLENPIDFNGIKRLIVGGEQLNEELAYNVHAKAKGEIEIYNEYGPTETTIGCTFYKYNPKELSQKANVLIGKPTPNSKIFILDANLNPVPYGISGEIYIGGKQLYRGYVSSVFLSDSRLINNPFIKGERLYRTGDLAKWLPDGNIEFLGRIDHQVKIRGFRIELGEIESTLQKYEGVQDSIVLAREEQGEKYLCAYIIAKGEINHEELRTFLSSHLPDYMVPAYFVDMEEFPLTTNGKVNRKVLPMPDLRAKETYLAPSSPLEEQLVKIWEEVLNVQPIGVLDNFYKIGGNSLLALILLNKIEEKLGERIQLSFFLQNLTIKELSSFIYKLFSWSATFHLDDSVIKNKNVISNIKIANLQTKGENLPLFFVAPLGGILPATSIVGIMDLPLLLGEKQPFYSIQVPPLFSDLAQIVSTGEELSLTDYNFKKDIIQQYVYECIQSVKNIYKGDQLYLGGFCSGCIFTMELAAQMEKTGYKVKDIFLIDPPLSKRFSKKSRNKKITQFSESIFNKDEIAWFITKDIGWKEKINLEDVIGKLRAANDEELWDVGINILKLHKSVSETTTSKDLKIAYYTKFYNQELITSYLSVNNYKYPKINAENATLIVAGLDEAIKNKRFAKTATKYINNSIAIENISGDHGSVFQQPNINQLVDIIERNVIQV